jgi:hypothetical protein
MRLRISALFAVMLFACTRVPAQEQPAPAPPSNPASNVPPASEEKSSSSKSNTKAIPSFLILGTVFNENALSFPGVEVRIRRTGEKKFLWEVHTNSRGEFAVRVPPGYEYEVMTHAKKYADQSVRVDSKVDVQQRLSIKLEPRGQGKTGAKP